MKVEFLDPAEDEFLDAVGYYNREGEGLGYKFAAEVGRTIGRIIEYPNAWASLSRRTRRCRTNRFPYGVVFQVRSDIILIVAVMHLHRDPESWKDRLPHGER
jgi:toxin ParE1/3/4